MTFKVLELSNPDWNKYIDSSFKYDFHHTSCLHRIEIKEGEIAKLFVTENKENILAFPLIIRKILNSDYFDATSVYGYGGPIASTDFNLLSTKTQNFFKEEFVKYCKNNKIIAVFSRLHPLIENKAFFNDFGKTIDLNKTVAIDLSLPLDEQRKGYRKSNKSEINQLKKKKGYHIKQVDPKDKQSIQNFVRIYHETMDRVEAKEYYFFDFAYFDKLLNNTCFKCNLLVAYKDGAMAAGAIFTETKTIMQYHLAGTAEDYIRDTPMKLILDVARLLGTEKKLKYLHLGGGVGGSDEDSLFRFKSGFSKNFFQFSVWNLIVDQKAYQNLVTEKQINPSEHPNFFPLYRAE